MGKIQLVPSLYSSLTSMYAYSSPEPFFGSTFPCSFATKVVFPDSLSPVKKTKTRYIGHAAVIGCVELTNDKNQLVR